MSAVPAGGESAAQPAGESPTSPAGIPTPALVVDLSIFDANVAAAHELVRGTGTVLWPHVKTHRVPALARRQLSRYAPGLTCATVREAEALAGHGIADILLANEIVTADKAARAAAVATTARLTVAVDSAPGAAALSRAATVAACEIAVLIDVDVGLGRCGVASPQAAADLAAVVARTPRLRLAGLMGYEGRIRTGADRTGRLAPALHRLAETRHKLAEAGLAPDRVSAGGTSSLPEMIAHPDVTEVQAGTYALMEPELEGPGSRFRCAAYVLATVVSRSGSRTVVDAGRRAIGCDYGPPVLLGPALTPAAADPPGQVVAVSDEHTVLRWHREPPALGDPVALRPSQIRTTCHRYDRVWLADGDRYTPYPTVDRSW